MLSVALLGLCAGAAEVLPSTRPPGSLALADTPQMVLLTFDDSVSTAAYAIAQQVLQGLANPNGHAIKATFFVCFGSGYDPVSMRQLYDQGHEIAVHTMSHATSEASSLTRWRQEIAGARRTLASLCGIPSQEIVGFRAPYLKPNDALFRVLAERGFLYDSTYREGLSGLSTSPTNMLWPYTLDHGLQQVTQPEYALATNYPGLFEIPLWPQFSNTTAVILMDPPENLSSNEVVELWKTNFLARYNGNRAPYGLFLHVSSPDQWLSNPTHSAWRIGALRAFIAWALAYPDTWFITCHDLVNFMLSPVAAAEAAASPIFMTPERTPYPTSAVSRCSYPGTHTFNVCGACPPAAPSYTNAYLGLVPLSGGSVSFTVVSQDATTAWCSLILSNNVPQQINDWSVSFTLTGGKLQGLYDATWTQVVDQVSAAARQYNTHLSPGAFRVLSFRVLRGTGEVTFSNASVAASGLGPQPIRLDIQPLSDLSGWQLTWEDNAHLYRVECATNLLDPQAWAAVTNELCQPALAQPAASDGSPRFYRIQGTIE